MKVKTDSRDQRELTRLDSLSFVAVIANERIRFERIQLQKRVDSMEAQLARDSAQGERWREVAHNAAVMIDRQGVLLRRLADSLSFSPPVTLRDTLNAVTRELALVKIENVELHNEHDAQIQVIGRLEAIVNVSRQQTALFRQAAEHAIATLDSTTHTVQQLRRELASRPARCRTGIPLVPCPTRKASFVLGAAAVVTVGLIAR